MTLLLLILQSGDLPVNPDKDTEGAVAEGEIDDVDDNNNNDNNDNDNDEYSF